MQHFLVRDFGLICAAAGGMWTMVLKYVLINALTLLNLSNVLYGNQQILPRFSATSTKGYAGMPNIVVYKKYANRRLYDTEKSIYVTLAQIAEQIRSGRQVRIEDAKTKEDVTAFILTQIILEEAKNKNVLLPAPLLHVIIQYGDNLLGEFFEKYFFQTLNTFVAHKKAVDSQFQKWLEMGMNMSKMAGINPFQSFLDPFGMEPRTKEGQNDKKK
jgi:polyhydroxyalkanoate synthesis repressor PhaR